MNVLLGLGSVLWRAEPPSYAKKVSKTTKLANSDNKTDQRQTKVKLKKRSQCLSLLKIVKFMVLFTLCNILTYCHAACPGTTISGATEKTRNIFGTSGSTSNVLTNRGYSLTKVEIWKTTGADSAGVKGIRMTYSSDCCGLADVAHDYGTLNPPNSPAYSKIITKIVTGVSFLYASGANKNLIDLEFTHPDSSKSRVCGCNASCNS